MATKKEVELELALWQERQNHIQTSVNLLNTQAGLLNIQAKESADNVARLNAELAKIVSEERPADGQSADVIPIKENQDGDNTYPPAASTAP